MTFDPMTKQTQLAYDAIGDLLHEHGHLLPEYERDEIKAAYCHLGGLLIAMSEDRQEVLT